MNSIWADLAFKIKGQNIRNKRQVTRRFRLAEHMKLEQVIAKEKEKSTK